MPARCTRVEVGKKSTARSWLLQMLMVWLVLTCLAQRNATRRSAHLIASCLSGKAGVHSEGGVQSYTRSLLTKPKNGGFSCNANVPLTCGSGFSQSKTSSSAVIISGLVTFIAAYHHMRIFNSWVDAYSFPEASQSVTGSPFNDAYRYMDWLLTVPLLLLEILLVMDLTPEQHSSKAWMLGLAAALMIVSGYYGELVVTGDLTPRWICWAISMALFLYIVQELNLPHGCGCSRC